MILKRTSVTILCGLVVSLPLLSNGQAKITKCEWSTTDCGCETDQGPIRMGEMTEEPFKIKDAKSNSFFFWHPCKDFTEGAVTARAIRKEVPFTYHDLGVHSSATSDVNSDGHMILKMVSEDKERQSLILCECTPGTEVTFTNEDPDNHYNFHAKSEYCCPTKDRSGGKPSGLELSIGSFIVLGFIGLVFIYLVLGTAYQTGVRKAHGIERIPNIELWSTLPGLVRDGIVFTFTCGRQRVTYINT